MEGIIRSVHSPATIYQNRLPGYEVAVVGGQENHCAGQILGFLKSPEGGLARIVFLFYFRHQQAAGFGVGETGSDGVDTNPVRPKLHGQRTGQANNTSLSLSSTV